ncbi:MAG: ATP-binding cassette domain-containing protein, partial [Planctomycetota bacterium]
VGAGRTELLRMVFGVERPRRGTIRVAGEPCRPAAPQDAILAGVFLCPEDRQQEGIVPMRSVAENINLCARRRNARWRCLLDRRWERANASRQIESLRIKTPSLRELVRHLSGGNQQKVILARALSAPVRVLLLDEPTRGIDIGARSEIYEIIATLAASGIGVLLASSDLCEVLGVADRVLVMRQGRLVGCLERGEATEESVLQLALPRSLKAPA